MVTRRSICNVGNYKFMINFGKQDDQSWLSVLFNDAVKLPRLFSVGDGE
jgi:hypothetical protein